MDDAGATPPWPTEPPGRALGQLFDRAPEIITLVDVDGNQRSVNDAARRILGYEAGTPWPPPGYSAIHPDDRALVAAQRQRLADPGGSIAEPFRFRVLDAQGRWRWLEALTADLFDVPGLECRVVFSREVTDAEEQRRALAQARLDAEAQADKLQAYDRARNDFLATISHELRTPLTSLSSAAELLLDDESAPLPEKLRSSVEVVQRSAERLRHLVEDLLLVERLDAGMVPVERAEVSLTELVELSADLVAAQADERGVTLHLTIAAEERVAGDELRLGQVLENLLVNAVKYSPKGSQVDVVAASTPGGVEVVVRDEGPGVDPDMRERIFDRFVRGAGADTSGTPGSGLGLSIAKAIVELHGGTIGVRDAPGGGAEFWFRIPTA